MDADARKELVDEERRRCVRAIQAMLDPESGPEYGMASDHERSQMRSHNSTLRCAINQIEMVRAEGLATVDQEKEKKAFLAGYINASGPANDAEYKIALEDAESAWVNYWPH